MARKKRFRFAFLCALVLLVGAGMALPSCAGITQQLYDSGVASRRADAGLETKSIVVDGRAFGYLERAGAPGGRTIVLVHGFGGSKDHWLALAPLLPTSARIIVPDLAGHGDSEAADGVEYDGPRLASEFYAALQELAPGRVDLVGNSLGGLVATLIALEHPASVRTLALLDPAGLASPVPSRSDSLLASGEAALIPTTRADYDRLIELSFVNPPDLPGIARDVLVQEARQREPFLMALLRNLGEQRDILADRLGALRGPTLLVWGEKDRILDPSAAGRWTGLQPAIELQTIPNVGHAPMMEVPAETAKILEAFWRTDFR